MPLKEEIDSINNEIQKANENDNEIVVLLNPDPESLLHTEPSTLSFKDVFKRISSLGLPMALSFTFSFEVFFVVFLLQHLSKKDDDIAAATLVSVMMNTVCVLGLSPLHAIAIYLSGKLGEWRKLLERTGNQLEPDTLEEKKEIISSTNANSLLIAALVTPPSFLALYYSKAILVSVFRQDDAVATIAQNFLRVYAFAVPGLMGRVSLEQVMFSFGKTSPAMWMALASLGIGGTLSVLLGFGLETQLGHIPRLETTGFALGFIIESYLTALSYGLYVGLHREFRAFNFFKNILKKIKNNRQQLKEILGLSSTISFTIAIELAILLAVGVLSGLVGTEAQSAMTYSMQFVYFEFIALAALSLSCAQELRRELGAEKYQDANKIAKYGLITTLIYISPLPLLFAFSPKILEFISGGASAKITATLKHLVPIMSAGVITDAVRYNLLQQLRGVGELFIPNVIAVFGMSAGIVLSAFLGLHTHLKIDGVATGYSVGVTLAALGLLLYWKRQIDPRKMIAVAKDPTLIPSLKSVFTFFKKAQLSLTEKSPLLTNVNNQPLRIGNT